MYAAMSPEQQRLFDSWSQSKQQALLRDLIEQNPLKVSAVLQSSDASCSAAAIPVGESPVPHHQLPRGSQVVAKTPQYVVASKAGPDAWEEPSIFLRDMIAYCNVAARRKMDIVWLGWQPGNAGVEVKHVDRFCSGAMCIAITKSGATKVYADMRAGHRDLKTANQWDIVLKKYLSSTQNNWHCYITPPIGGYTAHVTGCAPEEFSSSGGVRPSIWHSEWACTGTREDHDWQEKPRKNGCARSQKMATAIIWSQSLCKHPMKVLSGKVGGNQLRARMVVQQPALQVPSDRGLQQANRY